MRHHGRSCTNRSVNTSSDADQRDPADPHGSPEALNGAEPERGRCRCTRSGVRGWSAFTNVLNETLRICFVLSTTDSPNCSCNVLYLGRLELWIFVLFVHVKILTSCIMDAGQTYCMSRRIKKAAVGLGNASHLPRVTGAVDLMYESIRQSTVHVNVSQEMIVLTEDKLRLNLNSFLYREKKRREWYTPAAMLVTEIAATVTSNFHRSIGVSGDQWQAVFQVLIVLTLIWLASALTKVRRGPPVDSLIDSLKHPLQPTDIAPGKTSKQ
jgi:hypothetical protein